MNNTEILQLCDACCEGRLHPKTRSENEEYKSTQGQVIFHYSVCDNCGSELLDAADLLKNKRALIRFKKTVDGIPLGAEIAEMRKKHNLTQPVAATIFGGGPVAFSKYENDDLIPDESMVALLKLAIAYPDTIQNLAKVKGVEISPKETSFGKVEFWMRIEDQLCCLYSNVAEKSIHKPTVNPVLPKGKKAIASRPIKKSSTKIVKKIINGGESWVLH